MIQTFKLSTDEVTAYISHVAPTVKGFNLCGLYRMKQFHDTCRDDEFVSALLTQIRWANPLMLLSKARSKEERDFYAASAAKEPVCYFSCRRGALAEAACSNWSAL